MSLAGLLLGIINIAIVIAILVLIGLIIVWFLSYLNFAVPAQIQKVFMIIVALIALYMLVALLLGMPTVRIIGGFHRTGVPSAPVAAVSTATAVYL